MRIEFQLAKGCYLYQDVGKNWAYEM